MAAEEEESSGGGRRWWGRGENMRGRERRTYCFVLYRSVIIMIDE